MAQSGHPRAAAGDVSNVNRCEFLRCATPTTTRRRSTFGGDRAGNDRRRDDRNGNDEATATRGKARTKRNRSSAATKRRRSDDEATTKRQRGGEALPNLEGSRDSDPQRCHGPFLPCARPSHGSVGVILAVFLFVKGPWHRPAHDHFFLFYSAQTRTCPQCKSHVRGLSDF